jgi:4-amino-4-deoxy-L-arabinose transferase-like glycosyltransferase
MQLRKQHMVPEVHFGPSSPAAVQTSPPPDTETRAYVAKLLSKLPVQDQHFLVPYESFQPPLYYLTAGLIALVVPSHPEAVLYIGRLVAVLIGATTVYFCWLTTRELIPKAPMWAIASAGVVALLPSFCFDNAHASNDSMINLTATAAFYVWIRGLRHPEFDRRLFGAGALLGLALLSKLTAVALIPGLGLVILFRMFQVHPSAEGLGNWLKRGLYIIAGATLSTVAVCGWWFVRNFFTYGEFTGTTDALRFFAARFIKADFTRPRTARDLFGYTLESVWGRFGWNDITLPHEWYHVCNTTALFLISLSALAAIIGFTLWATGRRPSDVVKWQASLVFLAIGLTLLGGYVQFNQKIGYQPQARYFFILLLPGALLLTGGLHALAARRALRVIAFSILFMGLGLLNATALVTVSKAGTASGGVRGNQHHNAG